jgi:hypothetical protein
MNNSYFKDVIKELSKLMVGALTFVAALAWNEAFSDYFKTNLYLKGKGLLFYAISTSVIAIILITTINSVTKKSTSLVILAGLLGIGISLFYYFEHMSGKVTEDTTEKK